MVPEAILTNLTRGIVRRMLVILMKHIQDTTLILRMKNYITRHAVSGQDQSVWTMPTLKKDFMY